MPTQDDINSLQARLTSYRRTLGHYLRQRAMLSGPFEPPGIAAGIAEARHEIARLKDALHAWQVPVEDHPDDQSPAESASARDDTYLLPTHPVQTSAGSNHRHGMPFCPSRPLVPPEPIFGRDTLITRIARTLCDGQSVNVVGAKAMGKTTLLNYLLGEDGPLRDTLIDRAWLNLDAIHNSGQFYTVASAGLLAALPETQRRQPTMVALIAESQRADMANAQLLRRVLAAFAQLQPPRMPLLAVDNFENLLRPTSALAFHFPIFFNDLREMRQGRGLLMLVASDERIERYCTERRDGLTSSFHDGLMVAHIPELPEDAASALLLQPDGRHSLTNAEVRAAAAWASGHPRQLQVAGVALYRARDEGGGIDVAEGYYREQVPTPPPPASSTPNGGWLRWLLVLPHVVGQAIGRVGEHLDGMSAWVGGAIFILLLLLVAARVISLDDATTWFRGIIGLGGS